MNDKLTNKRKSLIKICKKILYNFQTVKQQLINNNDNITFQHIMNLSQHIKKKVKKKPFKNIKININLN